MTNTRPVVIKVGGSFVEATHCHAAFFQHIKQLHSSRPVVVVHGGGNKVANRLAALGHTSEKIDGLRVTPDAHLPIVTGVLAGECNSQLIAVAQAQAVNAVGLTLADGASTRCTITRPELGYVGEPATGDNRLLQLLLNADFLPIISSIGTTKQGEQVNVNADHAATVIAQLLDADLLLLADVEGVLDADKQLIPTIDQVAFARLCASEVIKDGMVVKVQAALDTANELQRPIVIGSWQHSKRLIAADLHQFGTTIYPTSI